MINPADLNPLLTKELRGRMRGWRAIGMLTIYLFLLGGQTWLVYALIAFNSSPADIVGAQFGKYLLGVVVIFQLFFVSLLAPAFTAGIITGEREKQTYDLLMTTLLRPRTIVLGKMGAALAWLLLLVLAVVPLSSLAFLLGGVAPEELILSLVVILATAFFYGAIGLFWSSVLRSTIAAVVLALVTIARLVVVAPAVYYMGVTALTLTNNGAPPAWLQNTPVLYANELLLSTHPLYALGASEAYLLNNQPIFLATTTLNGADVTVPQPWLVYTLFALLLGVALILLTIRNLPPVHGRRHAMPPPTIARSGVSPATSSAAPLPPAGPGEGMAAATLPAEPPRSESGEDS